MEIDPKSLAIAHSLQAASSSMYEPQYRAFEKRLRLSGYVIVHINALKKLEQSAMAEKEQNG